MANDDFFGRFGDMLGKGARSLRDRFNMDITDLIRAVDKNNYDEVERVLMASVDPNIADVLGRRALTMAVDNNSIEIVHLLLNNDANPNLVGRDGQTPLQKAVFWEHQGITKLLIQAGADPYLATATAASPIDIAQNDGLTRFVALMESQRKNRRAKQIADDKARHEALKEQAQRVRSERAQAAEMERLAAEKELARAQANKKIEAEQNAIRQYKNAEEDNFTAYIRALRQGDSKAARIFLDKMLDLNAVHPSLKTTPLLEAIRENNNELTSYLIDREVDMIHTVEDLGHSPLSMAVKKQAYNLVQLILTRNEGEVASVLNDKNQMMSLQSFAYKDAKMLDLLLEAGADPFFGGKEMPSPVVRAIEKASIAILPVLVKNNIDLNQKVQDKSLLEWAILFNKPAWVIGLLSERVERQSSSDMSLVELAKSKNVDSAIISALEA